MVQRSLRCMPVAFASLVLSMLAPMMAMAQSLPARPIRLVVPYPPGFTNDLTGRLLATRLAAATGGNFIVENRGGAEGQVGTESVARAAPDGTTLLLGANAPVVMRPIIFADLSYRTEDFTPIALLGKTAYVAVLHPSVKAAGLQEFVALVKAQPGRINYASLGSAGGPFMCAQLLKLKFGLEMEHVPYKGGAQAMSDLASGRVQLYCGSVGGIVPFVRSGKVKPLGAASLRRSVALPEVPTFVEQGVENFEAGSWTGVLGPLRLPPALVRRLSDELLRIAAVPETQAQLLSQGIEGPALSSEEFGAYLREEIPKWSAVVKAAGVTGVD